MKNLKWFQGYNSKVAFALALASLLFSPSAHSVTFQVSTSDEFQAALTTAASNGGDDEIVLAAGTYPGNFKFISEESAALVIRAADGLSEGEVVLDGEYRAFVFRFDARDFESNLTINGLTLTKAKSEVAGGALSLQGNGGELTLEDLVLVDNFAPKSAGIEAKDWTLITLRGSRFSDNGKYVNPSASNNAPGGEGAAHVSLDGARLVVEQNEFSSVSPHFDPATLENSFAAAFATVIQLTANRDGSDPSLGALDCESSDVASVEFQNNVLSDIGFVSVPDTTITDPGPAGPAASVRLPTVGSVISTYSECLSVSGNQFKNLELNGGLGNLGGAVFDFTDNLIANLRTSYRTELSAQSAFGLSTQLRFSGNRIVDVANQSQFSNEDYFLRLSGPVSFLDNVITDSSTGVEIFNDPISFDAASVAVVVEDNVFASVGTTCGLKITSNTSSVINNSIYRTTGSGICLEASDDSEMVVANNIAWAGPEATSGLDIERIGYGLKSTLVNNIFLSASELWDVEEGNSSLDPRFFDPESGDLHVTGDSPAINAGSNDYASSNTNDLDGNARVLDGTVDIGAYERNTTDLHPADTNGDSVISSAEFEAYNTAWRENDVWPAAPAIITADFVTRAGYLLQKGGAYKNIGVGKPTTWVPADE